jgi:hypothetical protein
MIFFFKKHHVVLDCFTHIPHVYDYAKIEHGNKYFPEWWKKTPKIIKQDLDKIPTIKNCAGVMDFCKKGIVLPSWFEMELTLHDEEERYCSVNSSYEVDFSGTHQKNQFDSFAENDGENLKFTSPWYFRTKENIDFVMAQPTWNSREMIPHMIMLPGVTNFKYQHHTEIAFLIIYQNKRVTISIPPLTPLAIFHPMSEKEIKIKNHLIDKTEWDRIVGYKKLILNKKANEKKIDKKQIIDKFRCPFEGDEK